MTLHVEGLWWHGPDDAARGAPVVVAPSHGYGYGVVALTHGIARVPRIWGAPPAGGSASRVPVH